MKKEVWQTLANKRLRSFMQIAKALGDAHPITKMMDTLAWGRHDWESGPKPRLERVIEEAAALDGAFKILNYWARDNDKGAQRTMLEIWFKEEE